MFPPGRYGRRRSPGRPVRAKRLKVAFLVVGVLIMAAITTILYLAYGNQEFSPNVVSVSKITNSSITVTFVVDKPRGVAASCTLQAFTYEDEQVGQVQAAIPATGTQVRMTRTITTTAKAYMVEIPDCEEVN